MSNKVERLMFSRKRLIADIELQAEIVEKYDKDTNCATLLSRKGILEEIWTDFRTNIQEIETSRDWIGSDEYVRETSQTRELYLATLVAITTLLPEDTTKLQQSLTMFQRREKSAATSTNNDDEQSIQGDGNDNGDESARMHSSTMVTTRNCRPSMGPSHQPGIVGLPATIKLPPLQIKSFGGNLVDWPEFQATCDGTFSEIMNEFSRFQYLKSHLTGEPARMVQHLPLTGAGSYDRAMDMLKQRYDNPRAIINANLKRLFDLSAPSNESVSALKNMLDTLNECISALTSLNIDTESWDSILIFILGQRLNANSIQYWEERIQGTKTVPKLSEFIKFLDIRINVLETTASTRSMTNTQIKPSVSQKQVLIATSNTKRCTICKQLHHYAFQCKQLLNLPEEDRMSFVSGKDLCVNCLYPHKVEECRSRFSCRYCNQRHNSLLHPPVKVHNLVTIDENQIEEQIDEQIEPEELQALEMQGEIIAHNDNQKNVGDVRLATAMIRIEHGHQSVLVRALIDSGATANIITKRIVDLLILPQTTVGIPITGICDTVAYTVKTQTNVCVRSSNSNYMLQAPALVVPRITTLSSSRCHEQWPHLEHLELADPDWQKGGRIDILLGSAAHAEILLNGLIKGESGQPIAQKTELGWIVSGGNGGQRQIMPIFTVKVTDEDLSMNLQRFWDNEEIPKRRILTPDEQAAENFFVKTTKRCLDGRFMVKLPFRNENPSLGDSKFIAKRRYNGTMKRLSTKPEIKAIYDQSIYEYLELGQMELADEFVWPHSYLPHHEVIKESSTTTKVRVVYDASCKTSNGNSLNSQLLVGPTIQSDLFSLLIHWRKGKYAVTGDIEKMYRQIWVAPEHTEFQRILWQAPGSTEIKSYRLKTVTFGVASAPFLAIRTLFLIAEDVRDNDPEMADKIMYQFYVDDFFDSVNTIEEAQMVIKRVSSKLAEYGFVLRKWKANNESILSALKTDEKDTSPSNVFKTLGVQWHPNTDEFLFLPAEFKEAKKWTKRTILSDISRLFDPLGWLSPCVVVAKMFMQQLWLLQASWDEQLPSSTIEEWLNIRQQFITSCAVKIPRWIGLTNRNQHVSLQGFCDASEKAIASVVFIRIQNDTQHVSCTLLAAKTKVAPLRKTSIPRLELNAAVLLANLMNKVKEALKIPDIQQQAWTDSEIVLHWLASHPSRWKTYVAHRVADIQNSLPSHHWRHVVSAQNPADCASRGMSREEIEQFKLWWHGPEFLSKNESEWPSHKLNITHYQNLEEKNQRVIATIQMTEPNLVINRFSSFERMLRVLSYCYRWYDRIKNTNTVNNHITDILSTFELRQTERRIIKITQSEAFGTEIMCLSKGQPINHKSNLYSIDPYIDDEGLLRVGGRIQRASMTENEKHPIILPTKHHFTTILIRNVHEQTFHGGFALTAQKLRQQFWIINNRVTIKSVLHRCTVCFRFKKKLLIQKMGDLPEYRLNETLPFTFVGVDYAGYFDIKSSTLRNAPYMKGYIAVFVCLTTRAIHLEVVSDQSTERFMHAFKRFISRRGIPSRIFSDNAGNFTGAAKEIQISLEQALSQTDSQINALLRAKRIKWSFIPARAPHFGGWESSVKLVKYHMERVLGKVRLCFEDFTTLITEIEAIVNSRPMWSVPSRTDEFEALTPGHFIMFKAPNTLPEGNVDHIPRNRLNQYQYLQRLRSEFWRLWSHEYIITLQNRKKWRETQQNVQLGQIVLVSEDDEHPSQWSLGKIVAVHPGSDGLVRAADVYCRSKTLSRPIHKLSLLPILDNKSVAAP